MAIVESDSSILLRMEFRRMRRDATRLEMGKYVWAPRPKMAAGQIGVNKVFTDSISTTPPYRPWQPAASYLRTEHTHLEHDTTSGLPLMSKEVYQDVYLKMRASHKGVVNTWRESTDPLKHVFEDIGIATFLMLFWKDMFATSSLKELDGSPWKSWLRPSGGFLDLWLWKWLVNTFSRLRVMWDTVSISSHGLPGHITPTHHRQP
ncbi:hypothetical protein EV424DRAFT_1588932 [Suillus variegatus]|nr:hypothetical protein EV424DRAFT_1588932 [Suillus variegatus]